MKHAFLIIAHNELRILNILLNMLDDSRNDIYIHLDKKWKLNLHDLYFPQRANLFFVRRMDVRWGDISLIKLEFKLFRMAYENGPYMYYHLLSGVDLPIKSQDYIHEFFKKNYGKEFIGFAQGEENEIDCYNKVMKFHLFSRHIQSSNMFLVLCRTRLENILNKYLTRNSSVPFKKGTQWISITNECCKYILNKEKSILKRFKFTICGDEIFLQTIVYNSPFYEKCYNISDEYVSNQREIDWKRGNPYNWTLEDKDILLRSDKIFARKIIGKNMDLALYIQNIFSKNN